MKVLFTEIGRSQVKQASKGVEGVVKVLDLENFCEIPLSCASGEFPWAVQYLNMHFGGEVWVPLPNIWELLWDWMRPSKRNSDRGILDLTLGNWRVERRNCKGAPGRRKIEERVSLGAEWRKCFEQEEGTSSTTHCQEVPWAEPSAGIWNEEERLIRVDLRESGERPGGEITLGGLTVRGMEKRACSWRVAEGQGKVFVLGLEKQKYCCRPRERDEKPGEGISEQSQVHWGNADCLMEEGLSSIVSMKSGQFLEAGAPAWRKGPGCGISSPSPNRARGSSFSL